MQKAQHIHFVGIKGVGVAPLALIAKQAGIEVTGSDIADGFITDAILKKNGITPLVGFDEEHIGDADFVITTGAHGGFDNVEVIAAKKRNTPVLTQGEAVGEFMLGTLLGVPTYTGISIAGTHGKTTTTAMVASIFSKAGSDPSWIVGTSEITGFGDAGHFGKGNYFIAEADEYANEPVYDKTPKILLQHPKIAVITNIEHDHPDVYPTIQKAYDAFLQFANLLPDDGVLVTCGDDIGVQEVLKKHKGNVKTYGFSNGNMYHIQNIRKTAEGVSWEIHSLGEIVALTLGITGEHNILNATAAYVVASSCGISLGEIQEGLLSFHGTKRRMEYIGQLASGALLYDDYAHHPTEITKTLTTLKEKYPHSHIVCIFQPHTYSRTKLLFDQFVDSLALADEIILSDIYSSKREVYDPTISSEMLAEKLSLRKKPTIFRKRLADVVKYVQEKHYGEKVVLVTMGAGDVYQIANDLFQE